MFSPFGLEVFPEVSLARGGMRLMFGNVHSPDPASDILLRMVGVASESQLSIGFLLFPAVPTLEVKPCSKDGREHLLVSDLPALA